MINKSSEKQIYERLASDYFHIGEVRHAHHYMSAFDTILHGQLNFFQPRFIHPIFYLKHLTKWMNVKHPL